MLYQTRIPAGVIPNTWYGRVAAVLIAAALAVVGLFFLAFAAVAAALIAVLVLVRIWWVARRLRAQRDAGVIEGSWSVEADPTRALRGARPESNVPPPASR